MPYGDKKSYSFFKMKYQENNSAFPFKTKTPNFSDDKQKELYRSSPEYRAYLKSKGITYDAKTGKSTKITSK